MACDIPAFASSLAADLRACAAASQAPAATRARQRSSSTARLQMASDIPAFASSLAALCNALESRAQSSSRTRGSSKLQRFAAKRGMARAAARTTSCLQSTKLQTRACATAGPSGCCSGRCASAFKAAARRSGGCLHSTASLTTPCSSAPSMSTSNASEKSCLQ